MRRRSDSTLASRALRLGLSVLGAATLTVAAQTPPIEPPSITPRSEIAVGRDGVFLDQIFEGPGSIDLPHLLVAPAPACGRTVALNRAALLDLVRQHAPGFTATNWAPQTVVRVSRRTRQLEEADLRTMLTETLQRDTVKDQGELELRFAKSWTAVTVPDETLSLKILDLPSSGISPQFIARFEIWNGSEKVGQYQLALQARIFRDVLVARANLSRGQLLADALVATERRDLLGLRDPLNPEHISPELELAEPVPAGRPLLARSVRVRPVLERGRIVEAVYSQGTMTINLKVEVLEDGVSGQTIRVRNPKTRREFQARVHNEQTVIILL